MYIDFSKFNYALVHPKERYKYVERDKKAYITILKNWFEENVNSIVDRKWEIEEILFIEEDSDFIKLLKEAESLYEFGFYSSCIALVGTAAEDCTKFFAVRAGAPNLATSTQYERLKSMLDEGILEIEQFAVLDKIRKIRNDCVHYNDRFKVKSTEELKEDSLEILNAFKDLIKIFFGFKQEVTFEKYMEILDASINASAGKDKHIKNIDDLKLKQRNALSQLLNIDITIEPGTEKISRESIYKVLEIDFSYKEVTLLDMGMGVPFVVDLLEADIRNLQEMKLKEQDTIYAAVTSTINSLGQSAEWFFMKVRKVNLNA